VICKPCVGEDRGHKIHEVRNCTAQFSFPGVKKGRRNGKPEHGLKRKNRRG